MADTILEDVTIANSIIFLEASIRDAEIRQSIIDENTHIEGLGTSGAVIGAHTKLNGQP